MNIGLRVRTFSYAIAALGTLLVFAVVLAAPDVPTEIEQPGTQPAEAAGFSPSCSCHYGTPNPLDEPGYGWDGSMMASSMKDPIFWATVAIAEQDFIPNADPAARGGAGDLCLRCHGPNGWIEERSTPTDGSSFTSADDRGVECEFCHLMVDPDQPVSVPGTTEVQNSPFLAYDPDTGEGYYGSAQWVINGGGTRLGPYDDHEATHQALGSSYFRDSKFCGTCHDVSNPAVGDLAHNHGAQVPLEEGTYSGVLGSPVDGKAAFNNFPYQYGVVERTYSEHVASGLDTFRVNNYPSLPADLRVPNGILDFAYHQAFDARNDADFEDGDPRYYTCQTCHMSAATGYGCDKNNMPLRTDLGRHDMTGGGYWMPDVIFYQFDNGLLRLGSITTDQRNAMEYGQARATARLQAAASLQGSQSGNDLVVRVTNLTGHKLLSGYPEGRRQWINIRWLDSGGGLVREDGAYGQIGRTVDDLSGTPHQVESILDLENTVIFQAEMGMDQEWANQLLSLGYSTDLALSYDRMTDGVEHTLGELGGELAGTMYHTFHFVINNQMIHDNRIPPYLMAYDDAEERNIVPVPADQFGNPGPGGVYDHWGEYPFSIPAGAATAEVRLYYQQTSWEYVQFLWLANDRQGPFLGDEGVNMLDAFLNTGQNAPLEMEFVSVPVTPQASGTPGETSHGDVPADQMLASYDSGTGLIDVTYTPACDAAEHTIYFGDLAAVSTYGYSGAACSVGVSGSASFDPGGLASAFFLIVGNDLIEEGSYGLDGAGLERPEDIGTPVCDVPQNLGGVICE